MPDPASLPWTATQDAQAARVQSRNFQVSAPSKRLTMTDSRSVGSKFRRFTPWRAPGADSIGSQWVAMPQVLHRTLFKVRSPQT
jgi:hypothetical protein